MIHSVHCAHIVINRVIVVMDDEQERYALTEEDVSSKMQPAAVSSLDWGNLFRDIVPNVDQSVHAHRELPKEGAANEVLQICVSFHFRTVSIPLEIHCRDNNISHGKIKCVKCKGSTVQGSESGHDHIQRRGDEQATEADDRDGGDSSVETGHENES